MLPSILSAQVRQGIEDFLRTTFPVTTPFFHEIFDRFLKTPEALFRGPYLSIRLPFQQGEVEADRFSGFTLPFPPYRHQAQAFERLGGPAPRPTIVATGTGSGKTESFLYPILEHCYRQRGVPGIKALIIYPMNALANDQARRLARMIYQSPNLRGNVTAGLYVGGQQGESASGAMLPEQLITDKNTLRLAPPDILLTNYKMLDYLLIRPADLPLWQQNRPETLRYLVVDELHTFDGAQGTDLACLIRRLKARLRTPPGQLCCVGTSATLGDSDDSGRLREYAGQIFGERFEADAVIREALLSPEAFYGESEVRYHQIPPPETLAQLRPESYPGIIEYLQAQHLLWFGEGVSDPQGGDWQVVLGDRLKQMNFFLRVIALLDRRTRSLPELGERLAQQLPEFTVGEEQYRQAVLQSFVSLVAAARVREGERLRPFLDVRMQLWLRELRRLVADVKALPEIRFSDDLSAEQLARHLPLVHCRECGALGWGATRRNQDHYLNADLQHFYQSFFNRSPTVTYIFPHDPDEGEKPVEGRYRQHLCGHCLHISSGEAVESCLNCGANDRLLAVRIENQRIRRENSLQGSRNCPFCGAYDGLTIVGSRAASLTSVAIGELFSSPYNDDKKLLTFSDSVQDASHRAGFFEARTFRFNFRAALQQFVAQQQGPLPLEEVSAGMIRYWRERMTEQAFIATLLPPDLDWLEEYDVLKSRQQLPAQATLPQYLAQRISWEVYAEYGFNARIGRTLEKTGSSLAYPDPELLAAALQEMLDPLRNEIGELRELTPRELAPFLEGLITQLRIRGGIFHPALNDYIAGWGGYYRINLIPYMPNFGKLTRTPAFLTNKPAVARFDTLLGRNPQNPTWYEAWAVKNFAPLSQLLDPYLDKIYEIVLAELTARGILRRQNQRGGAVWGINPAALQVSPEVQQLRCGRCGHNASVASVSAASWQNAPCLRFGCTGRYRAEPLRDDYYRRRYAEGDVARIFAAEHTGLLTREEREALEERFQERQSPWDPNLLSCTPTLEMGVDIGDLSSVILCSVPPAQAGYLQRIGRAGRKDGNAFNFTVAAGRPHDLYFFAAPLEMIAGNVEPPGCFLNAPAVLERQLTAFCFDRWIESGVPAGAVPVRLKAVLNNLGRQDLSGVFPYNLLAFIDQHRGELLAAFIAIFPESLSQAAAAHLERFIAGGAGDGGLGYRIITALEEVAGEVKSLRDKVKRLTRLIKELEDNPAKDQHYQKNLDELIREKTALNGIIQRIHQKATYNFFTDEGLLPNYTFPEAGVLLRSVIFRRKQKPDAEGKYHTRIYEYERPAASAIHELAPANHFYAGGRRVMIDQVDLGLSETEAWRFCNNCSYHARELQDGKKKSCPQCGSPLWADEGQKRRMLRLRQVVANTSDRESRSRDESDDREPEFYHKHLLVEAPEANVEKAYRIDDDTLPFGFEYLSRVTLREINFGPRSLAGETIDIAGQQFPRQGFEVCNVCGKIQQDKNKPLHALNCRYRNSDSRDMISEYLYLYREFSSEAFRILIPELAHDEGGGMLHSFIAALFLGLKKYFHGNIDHLRTAVQREPLPGGQYSKKYLVLYDQVPGGTGYLKELMRPELPLLEVLDTAYQVLKACSCQPEQGQTDGCYRCLYAYRFSYDMRDISRKTALELLSRILSRRERFVEVESINRISVNVLFDSELEARFIAALSRAGSPELPLQMRKQLVKGKPGYYLNVNGRGYTVEPQADLGPAQGIGNPSRPDFVFYPEKEQTARPLALFTDGFAYHVDAAGHTTRVGKDLAQRLSLLRSGRYRVWSLTWDDVEQAGKPPGKYADDFLVNDANMRNQLLKHYEKQFAGRGAGDLHQLGSFELLLRYLADPDPVLWRTYALVQWLLLLRTPIVTIDAAAVQAGLEAQMANRPGGELSFPHLQTVADGGYLGSFREQLDDDQLPLVRLFAFAEKSAVQQSAVDQLWLAARLFDDAGQIVKSSFRPAWNGFLRLFNYLQFIPQSLYVSSQGIAAGEYAPFEIELEDLATETDTGSNAALEALKSLTDPLLHPLLDDLHQGGLPLPEAGYELCDRRGMVVATAELGWPAQRIALLLEHEMPLAEQFRSRKWQVHPLEEVVQDFRIIYEMLGGD
ncbi:MAG: DEAD/DEAH box helicase [Calditrichaeota bacterium]|nr:DEAD/DEAH box helicase [Calditrichota bacterium]